MPHKSGAVAAILSAALPGTGKLYLGRLRDAVISVAVIGFSSWQAYDGFINDGRQSVKGYIFSSIGAAFYAANIYGSAIAVRAYNDTQRQNVLRKIDIAINLQIKW
jgi:TM2 domain-containing membrane protein YozV